MRGLGWDIEAPFCTNKDLSSGAYGHLGYTGTSIWIDPVNETYALVLTNRVHPAGKGDIKEFREKVRSILSEAMGPLPTASASR